MEAHTVIRCIFSFVLGLSVLAAAQIPDPAGLVEISTRGGTIAAGKESPVKLSVWVSPGYHVQANPASENNLVSTAVELSPPPPDIILVKAEYPKGTPLKIGRSKRELLTYAGTFDVNLTLQASMTAKKGKRKLAGLIRYQLCNAENCFFPVKEPFSIPLKIH